MLGRWWTASWQVGCVDRSCARAPRPEGSPGGSAFTSSRYQSGGWLTDGRALPSQPTSTSSSPLERPSPRDGVTVTFDKESLRRFYLFDVVLHEVGHHVDRHRTSGDAERYARW